MNGCNDNSGTNASQQNNVATKSNTDVLPPQFIGRITTPYGVQYINSGEASDHASMRSAQMTGLLMMMRDEGAERYRTLPPRLQETLMWMVTELSREIEAMFDIVAGDAVESKQ